MNINLGSFSHPLKQFPIYVNGEQFHLCARFLEIDRALPYTTNLDLKTMDTNIVTLFEGLLLLEILSTDIDQEVCGFAIYGRYDQTTILTDIHTKMHHDAFIDIFTDWAQRISGSEVITPDENGLDVIRDVLFVMNEHISPIRRSRTGIVESLMQLHKSLQYRRRVS